LVVCAALNLFWQKNRNISRQAATANAKITESTNVVLLVKSTKSTKADEQSHCHTPTNM